ncbi:hypothetical protein CI238_08973, partial [Colletotrichum incanum]
LIRILAARLKASSWSTMPPRPGHGVNLVETFAAAGRGAVATGTLAGGTTSYWPSNYTHPNASEGHRPPRSLSFLLACIQHGDIVFAAAYLDVQRAQTCQAEPNDQPSLDRPGAAVCAGKLPDQHVI